MKLKLNSREYSAALAERRLLGLKCLSCGTITAPPKAVCRHCTGTELEIVQLSGHGTLQTFTTVITAPEFMKDKVPYLVVLIALDEGPWIMGNLDGVDPAAAAMDLMGRRVKMGNISFPLDESSAAIHFELDI